MNDFLKALLFIFIAIGGIIGATLISNHFKEPIQVNYKDVNCKHIVEHLDKALKESEEVIESEECKDYETFKDTIYFLDGDITKKLPFCALNWDRTTGKKINEDYCYDWAFWDDYQGVSIINLND